MTEPSAIRTRDYWPTDGWRTASPGDHGLDAAMLDAAQAYLDEHVPHIESLLIVRGGYLVYEHYRLGVDPAALHNVKSMAKSFTSALAGIAIGAGDLESDREPIGSLLPEVFATVHERAKRDITVRDLLTMRSGLEWQEYGPSAVQMTASPDWVRFVLERPLIHPPGTHFNYSTGDAQLLAAVLQQATGMTLLDYADLYLFRPLGITQRRWPADPQGITIGGAELALTPRDMAKFGYLVSQPGHLGRRPDHPGGVGARVGGVSHAVPPGHDRELRDGGLWLSVVAAPAGSLREHDRGGLRRPVCLCDPGSGSGGRDDRADQRRAGAFQE